jgi:hypothetical protein
VERRPENRVFRRWIHARSVYFEKGPLEEGTGSLTGVHFLAQAVDISEGGIGMITQLPLREKEVIRVLVPGPEPSTSLPVQAEVVWSAPARTSMRYGLRFLS